MLFGEIVGLRALQVHHADHPAAVFERHGHLRAGFRIHHDVARVLVDVPNHNGLAALGRRADNPFAAAHGTLVGHALVAPQ